MRRRALLGIDFGRTRVRAALRRAGAEGIAAIAVRDVPQGAWDGDAIAEIDLVAALLEEIVEELGAKGAACVSAVGPPSASLHAMRFPRMSRVERAHAAKIDIERRSPARKAAVVRVRPVEDDAERCAVGAVDERALRSRADAARRARLRPLAVDYEGFALLRCFPQVDAVLDVAHERTTLHAAVDGVVSSWWSAVGGRTVTAAICEALDVDERTAEERKRVVGIAGAGERGLGEVAREAAALVESARRRRSIERIALAGNGSRVLGTRSALERAAGVTVAAGSLGLWSAHACPPEIARAASAEWSLAAGLALWRD